MFDVINSYECKGRLLELQIFVSRLLSSRKVQEIKNSQSNKFLLEPKNSSEVITKVQTSHREFSGTDDLLYSFSFEC